MIAENPQEFENDSSTFDKLVRAQHYGLPTRLLDVSTNPLVALYFACSSNFTEDGDVLVVGGSKIRHKFYDSDTVSLLANLSFLKRKEKEDLYSYAKEHGLGSKQKDRVENFEKCPELDRLIQTVRAEKPHFRSEVDPFDLAFVQSVTPKKSHDRIRAQEGQFIIFGLNEEDSGNHLEYLTIEKISISAKSKKQILADLSLLGVSERSLFPEIEKTATQIIQKYS